MTLLAYMTLYNIQSTCIVQYGDLMYRTYDLYDYIYTHQHKLNIILFNEG